MPFIFTSVSLCRKNDGEVKMKLVSLSDAHLLWDKPINRLDDTKETQFVKLRAIFDYATAHSCEMVIAGDVSNKSRSWHLLPEIIKLLKEYNIIPNVVAGQHDQYLYNQQSIQSTSLGVCAVAGLMRILKEDPYCPTPDIAMYGCSFGQSIPVVQNKNQFNILIIHAPIAAQALWPGQNYMDALTFLKENEKFNLIVAGDIHQKYMISYKGRYIINSGPLIRKEASEYNFLHHPGFFVFDTDKTDPPEFIEVPHLPAEKVLSRMHIEYEKESKSLLTEFIASISEQEIDEDVNYIENLWRFIKKNDISLSVQNLLSEVTNK